MGNRHLISRGPSVRDCQRCGCTVLAGIDEGIPYRVDTVPLNATGELTARLDGRTPYAFIAQQCTYRDISRMGTDAKYGRPPVLATHRCGTPLAGHVATEHVGKMTAFLAGWRRVHAAEVSDVQLEDAMMVISEVLGARVIDRPPF